LSGVDSIVHLTRETVSTFVKLQTIKVLNRTAGLLTNQSIVAQSFSLEPKISIVGMVPN